MITVNIDKAKVIAHEIRRQSRAEEFKPHDEVIMKQIPGNNYVQAEAARQTIRDKYTIMQNEIDSATTVEEIKSAMPPIGV
jgi:hypothetical protein